MVYALRSLYCTTLLKDYKKFLVTNATINLVTYKLHTLNTLSRSILSGPPLGKDPRGSIRVRDHQIFSFRVLANRSSAR